MKIISFAWTTPALLAGQKTCTRRDWEPRYGRMFGKAGDLVAAYDRSPRYKGQQVGTIRLTYTPYQESTRDAPPGDYYAEGFGYLTEHGIKVDGMMPMALWQAWHHERHAENLWVVRFELVEVGPNEPDPRIMRPGTTRLAPPAGARLL
jgi:hypothetical protein